MAAAAWYRNAEALATITAMLKERRSHAACRAWLTAQGYAVTPRSFRRQLHEQGLTHLNDDRTPPPAIEQPPEPTPEERLADSLSRQKQRDEETYHRKRLAELLKGEARFQRLLDLIREVTAAIPMPDVEPPPPVETADGAERICMFVVSDVQVGIAMDPLEVGERLAYNSGTLEGRFSVFEAAVWRFLDEQRQIGPLVGISIPMPGDVLENHQLRIGARQRTDLALTTAAITFNRLFSRFLARLWMRYQVPIDVDILPGNHDRIGGGKQGDEKTYDNWAVIIGEMLRIQFEREPGVTIHVHFQEYAVLQFGASRVMLHHGHGIQGTALLPWYGIDRRVGRWEGFHRQQFSYVVLGHFHNPAMWQTVSGAKVYINGAWFDSTAYGASLGLATPAQQLAFALTEAEGIVYTRELALSEPLEATPAEPRDWPPAA